MESLRWKWNLTVQHVKRVGPVLGPLFLASLGIAIVRRDAAWFAIVGVVIVLVGLLFLLAPRRWYKPPEEQRKVDERMARKPVIGMLWRKNFLNRNNPYAIDMKELRERDAQSPPGPSS